MRISCDLLSKRLTYLSINNFIETAPLERGRGRKPQKNPTAENHREKEEIEIL